MLQQLADLLASKPQLKRGQAIQQVAKNVYGADWRRCWARLRRRKLVLPKPRTKETYREKVSAEFDEVYRRDAANRQAAKEQRARKVKEAESLGLQIDGQRIFDLTKDLERERERIFGIIHQPFGSAAYYYKNQGIELEEAKRQHFENLDKYELLEKQIAVLREIQALPD